MTDVSIADRPVTQHGLVGMRPVTSGPGRMVQDASYFVGVLRQKITEISTEIDRMKGEHEKATSNAAVMAQYERKYEALIKEVRSLEGDLADYNLAMDKSRTSMDASEILAFRDALKRRNEAASRDVDAVFMERQERERGAHRLEEQIAEIERASEARMNSLAPALQAEYRALSDENKALGSEISSLQGQLEALNSHVEAAESAVRRDRVRDEYALLEKRAQLLGREREALEEEMAATRLDPAEARDRLLAKVKDDNARIQALERSLKAAEEKLAGQRKALAELSADIEERRGEASDSAKYELLFKRDQEMTEFIDRFEEMRDKELAEQRRTQNLIVALMEHISEGMERETSMPSREQADEMKEDLDDKNRELKAAHMTHERLQEELTLRQTELDKISTLDVKIAAELKTLNERMAAMRAEMRKFADLDGLRATAALVKKEVEAKSVTYAKRRDMMRAQLQALSLEYDRKRAQLAKDPQAAALDALETKLKNQEQTVFALKEFVATKGRESDYEALKAEDMRLCAEINVKAQNAQLVIADTGLLGAAALASSGMPVGSGRKS